MGNTIERRMLLVVSVYHVPRAVFSVRMGEHLILARTAASRLALSEKLQFLFGNAKFGLTATETYQMSSGITTTGLLFTFFSPGKWMSISEVNFSCLRDPHELQVMSPPSSVTKLHSNPVCWRR